MFNSSIINVTLVLQLNSETDVYNRKKIRMENIQNNPLMKLKEKEVQFTLQTPKDPKDKEAALAIPGCSSKVSIYIH